MLKVQRVLQRSLTPSRPENKKTGKQNDTRFILLCRNNRVCDLCSEVNVQGCGGGRNKIKDDN